MAAEKSEINYNAQK